MTKILSALLGAGTLAHRAYSQAENRKKAETRIVQSNERIAQADERKRLSIIKGLSPGPEKDRLLFQLLNEMDGKES